jgi:hypothetical protein
MEVAMALILPRSVMIHIPKTGGTWCAKAIKNAGIKYEEPKLPGATLVQYRHCSIDAVADRIGDRLTFGFVRHPLSWIRSNWRYICDRGVYKKWKKPFKHWTAKCWSLDFLTFVKNVIHKFPGTPSNAMFSRLGYIANPEKKIWEPGPNVVKFIGRTEHLSGDLIEALARAGETFDMIKVGATPRARVSKTEVNREATPKLVKLVEKHNPQLMELLSK